MSIPDAVMIRRSLKRSVLQRLLGVPATRRPRDDGCWTFGNGIVRIDLSRVPELRRREGAIRLDGSDLPVPILVFRGDDARLHVFLNRCGHRGRCIDPLGGTCKLQCCSVGRSLFDYRGRVVQGPASRPLQACPFVRKAGHLLVLLRGAQAAAARSAYRRQTQNTVFRGLRIDPASLPRGHRF